MIGLVAVGVVAVVAIGLPALNDISDQTQVDVAQDSMSEASASLANLASQSGSSSRSFTIQNELGGNVVVNGSSAAVTIGVRPAGASAWENETVEVGTITYEQEGKTIALQSGGVWRLSDNGPVMISQPSLEFTGGQLNLALIDLAKREPISKGQIVVTRNETRSRRATRRVMRTLSDVWQDAGVDAIDVTVRIETEYAEAWRSYAAQNFEGNVSVASSDDSVTMTFHGLPADRDSVAPLDVSTVSTSGAVPTGSGAPVTSESGSTSPPVGGPDGAARRPWGGSPGRAASSDTPGAGTGASSAVRPWTDPGDAAANETLGWCPSDFNRGHGNDCGNYDPDNPGKSKSGRSETAAPADADGDDVADARDDCPSVAGRGSNGCPLVEESAHGLTVNAESATVTHLGTQIGRINRTNITRVTRRPLAVTFVLDESGSMLRGDYIDQYRLFSETTVPSGRVYLSSGNVYRPGDTVPEGTYVYEFEAGNDIYGERIDATRAFIASLNDTRDRAGALYFDTSTTVMHPLTGDLEAVSDALYTAPGGYTNISAGIYRGIDQFDGSNRKRVMVLLSDGRHNQGAPTPREAAEDAARKDITIYTVGLGSGVDESQLRSVAAATGGTYYAVSDANGLERTFQHIANNTDTRRVRAVDQYPVETTVSLGSGQWSLDSVNDPTAVDPTDPALRTRTFDISPGATLGLRTTVYELRDLTQSNITQTHDGTGYVHRGGTAGSVIDRVSQYRVYTDGERLELRTEWWQQSVSELLAPVNASVGANGRLDLPAGQALVEVPTAEGYSLLLVEAGDADRPPVPVLTVDNARPTAGRPVTVDASDSFDPDADDDIVSYKFGNGSWQDSPTAALAFRNTTDLTLTVRNDENETASITQRIEISNHPVVANLTTPDRTVFKGEPVRLDATGSYDPDAGEGVGRYSWTSNAVPSRGTATATFDHGGTGTRNRTVGVTVVGDDGTVSKATLAVAVRNRAPAVTLTADRATAAPGTDITLTANASDPDPGESIARYEWDNVDSASGDTATASFGATGDRMIRVTVYSTDGSSTTANLTVSVARSVELFADEWVYKGEDPDLEVANAGTVRKWLVNGTENPSMSGADPTVAWDLVGRPGNTTKNVTAVVRKNGRTATPSVAIEVRNREPVANLTVGDDRVHVNETVRLDATNSVDVDAGEHVVDYAWTAKNATVRDGVVEVSFPDDGRKTVGVTVESSDGTTTTTTVDIVVESRDPVARLRADSAWVYEGDTVAFDASNSSAPAGASVVSYAWSNVDSVGPVGETATATFTDNGTEQVTVTVESSDGTTETAAVNVSVIDRPPIAELEARSTNATPVLTLDATGSYDPDAGDTAAVTRLELVSRPGTNATLNGTLSDPVRGLVNVTESGVYRFEATVTSDGKTATTEVAVSIGLDGANAPVSVSVVEVEAEND